MTTKSDQPELPPEVKINLQRLNEVVAETLNQRVDKEFYQPTFGAPLKEPTDEEVRAFLKKHLEEILKGGMAPAGTVGRVVDADPATEAGERLAGTFDPNSVRIELTVPVPVEFIKIDFTLASDGKFKLTE